MPATEQAWRDQKLLHLVFGVSCVLLLISTIWMFAADHDREWKAFQDTSRDIEIINTEWRTLQFRTDAWIREHGELQEQLRQQQAAGIDPQLIEAFKLEVQRDAEERGASPRRMGRLDGRVEELSAAMERARAVRHGRSAQNGDEAIVGYNQRLTEVERARVQLEEAQQQVVQAEEALGEAQAAQRAAPDDAAASQAVEAASARVERARQQLQEREAALSDADSELQRAERALLEAEAEVVRRRDAVLDEMRPFVADAQFRESALLQDRKFQSANLDAARANLDLAIRDHRTEQFPRLQQRINQFEERIGEVTLRYQAAARHRQDLQEIIRQATAEEEELARKVAENEAERQRLERALGERRSTFFTFAYGMIPLPGKRWLEMPILDAFNSPRQIANRWSDGLEQDFNFGNVRRFDRCMTCHHGIDKSMPGTPDIPAHGDQMTLTFVVDPTRVERADDVRPGDALELPVDDFLGVRLEERGLVARDDVTISLVEPQSLAAKARLKPPIEGDPRFTAAELRESLFHPAIDPLEPVYGAPDVGMPGLLVGDVIVEIQGVRVRGKERALFRLGELKRSGRPFDITVRRGLPQPYSSHPRLDLFVGSLSPHPEEQFACTICHEGQGSATDFKWASHTPNSESQRRDWTAKYGWFDNHHWIYPMYPGRFAESTCLKCHHNVVELQPSERFPDPPAPTLMHGYDLIRKYGCYGCHEVGGFDGPDRRIGPDLRLEPNFFAAALEIMGNPHSGFDTLSASEKSAIQTLAEHPEDNATRRRVNHILAQDMAAEETRLSDDVHNRLAPLLKDVDVPGKLRKSGPSLRYVQQKLDDAFLYDWIRDPQHFRPSTRMPKFFGLVDHLIDPHNEELTKARLDGTEAFEQIEILGLVTYLNQRSQSFEFVEPPEDVDESTSEEMIERGRLLFQERGCLACHTHQDFPEAAAMHQPGEIIQGPDLSGVADKFDPERNPDGARWLYTWIKKPSRYHSRTVMPDMILEPITHRDELGEVTSVTDPVADIVQYLFATSSTGWQPDRPVLELDSRQRQNLDALTREHLQEAFFVRTAEEYLERGIPESRSQNIKVAERELIVPDEDFERGVRLTDEQKLVYIGNKSITKYGCYGCHDIAGFEDAKPIGTGLADWGRKDPATLAFEHVTHFLDHPVGQPEAERPLGHGRVGHVGGPIGPQPADAHDDPGHRGAPHTPGFFLREIKSGNRIGFIYQKLRQPRSYDYEKTDNKRYNERLRMPQFPFSDEDREAVMTFVLGLVAEPPTPKYVYTPDERERALIEGRVVLEKYNCGACHILEAEKWELAYPADYYGPQKTAETYPFVRPPVSLEEKRDSLKRDRQNLLHATLVGMPALGDDGLPLINDDEGDSLVFSPAGTRFDPSNVEYAFQLWKSTILDGEPYEVTELAVNIPASHVRKRHDSQGGYLAKYLLPYVVAREREVNPNAKGSEAWGWLPPHLVGQGNKVQAEWLYRFLLDPHPIRPATVLRMPKFNMSSDEAKALVNYFAAKDNAHYPYELKERRRREHLAASDSEYRQRLGEALETEQPRGVRLSDAMRIVVDNNYCVKCHLVGDFDPPGADRAKAPDLAVVYERMRTDYLRQWLAKPTSILPYTSMPVNIPYDPEAEHQGGVSQQLYHGTSLDQLDAVVDLLMNYDEFTKQRTSISSLVEAAMPEEETPEADAPVTDAPVTEATEAEEASGAE